MAHVSQYTSSDTQFTISEFIAFMYTAEIGDWRCHAHVQGAAKKT